MYKLSINKIFQFFILLIFVSYGIADLTKDYIFYLSILVSFLIIFILMFSLHLNENVSLLVSKNTPVFLLFFVLLAIVMLAPVKKIIFVRQILIPNTKVSCYV